MSSARLKVERLCKSFTRESPPVVNEVSFELAAGELLTLIGPSGCGKTTTLRLIAGFERADSGEISLGTCALVSVSGKKKLHVPPQRREIGVVFQDYALFPHLTVLSNVMFGMNRDPVKSQRQKAMDLLTMLNIAELASRTPHTLSGGQQQRVALARTMAALPRLILLDEPFSNLDVTLRESARRDVRAFLASQGVTAILVTHDREEALSMGDRVAVMSQGRLMQVDTPKQVYHHPQTEFVAQFLGEAISLQCVGKGNVAESPLGPVTLNRPAQGTITALLRPEQIRLVSPDQAFLTGYIQQREFRGATQTLSVRVGEVIYPVVSDSTTTREPGDMVGLQIIGPAMLL
ncbi:MAG TPA: ABC transporter ATP-binding protein [Planctomicrobium sp.]|nr:ABC transporter ATP-binding protein [Planctomicrobium sp.]